MQFEIAFFEEVWYIEYAMMPAIIGRSEFIWLLSISPVLLPSGVAMSITKTRRLKVADRRKMVSTRGWFPAATG